MRRILRMPPIFEVPGHVVYAPMRKSTQKDIPVRVVSTAQAGKAITGMKHVAAMYIVGCVVESA